jgi:DNA-binding PadR family transcriptional regulator
MLILGVVRVYQPIHGYDVRRELLSWHADDWAKIAPGSVYHALKKLAEEELLRDIGTEQMGGRPARTRYEVTAKGETEFQNLLRRYWWEYREPSDPFHSAYVFLPVLPQAEGVAALRNRARMLRLAADGTELRASVTHADMPAHVLELLQLEIDRARLEASWCERVAARLETGELPMPCPTGGSGERRHAT